MTLIRIFLAPREQSKRLFMMDTNEVQSVRDNLGSYLSMCNIETDLVGEAGAEEAFDLTNNPDRQEERREKYGLGRSLSVGDVVQVGDEKFVCLSVGWEKL